jgi:hypothetical protein
LGSKATNTWGIITNNKDIIFKQGLSSTATAMIKIFLLTLLKKTWKEDNYSV